MKTKGSLLAALTLGTALCGTTVSAETLIVAHGYTPTHTLVTQWIQPWMSCVAERTKGEVDFNYFPSGQIVTVPTAVSSMEAGLADVSVAAMGSNTDRFPLNGVTMLPSMGDTALQMVKAYRNALESLPPLRREFTDSDILPLSVNMTPPYQIMWRRDPRVTLEAIAGQKVRTQEGAMSLAARSLGAAPVEMPSADIYVALERGSIDGILLAPMSVPPYHLNEVLGAISRNASFGSSASVLSISQSAFGRLTQDAQKHVLACGVELETVVAAYYDDENDELLEKFRSEGIKIYDFAPDELTKIATLLESVPLAFIDRVTAMGRPADETFRYYREILASIE